MRVTFTKPMVGATFKWMNVSKVRPPHDVPSYSVKQLAQAMKHAGWCGRPIVVLPKSSKKTYQAVTGSHRIRAARKAGLKRIPVLVLDKSFAPYIWDDFYCNSIEELKDRCAMLVHVLKFDTYRDGAGYAEKIYTK